jgi:ribosomal peptide maturation radical SAM protein 1
MTEGRRVLLVHMPWTSVYRPALGLSLLKAELERDGLACDVRYLNHVWANILSAHFGIPPTRAATRDLDDHLRELLLQGASHPAMADEWVFAKHLFGDRIPSADEFVERFAMRGRDVLEQVLAVHSLVPAFIERCLADVPWDAYDIVGFGSTFRQHFSALLLAKALRTRYPHLKIVFGGANCEGPMGMGLLRHFPFVDYVVSGEADNAFPALVRRIREGRDAHDVSSVILRGPDGPALAQGPERPVVLDELPSPDFSEFFDQYSANLTPARDDIRISLEQSRGCWWGAKHHCTFCGLNGQTMATRAKSAQRALAELDEVHARYGITRIDFSDNILQMDYYTSLLPELAKRENGPTLFYEIKSNVKRAHIEILRAAGVRRIQPGIEALSTHVLKLMRKGCTAMQNVQCMKWAHQYGITVEWNLLYGFPGETSEDYKETLAVLQAINLRQPAGCYPIRMDRFSPNYLQHRLMGFANVRPAAPYTFLYPFSTDELVELAYYFDHDYEGEDRRASTHLGDVSAFVERWMEQTDRGQLTHATTTDGRGVIDDSRFNMPRAVEVLSADENAIYRACDEARTLAQIEAEVSWVPRARIEAALQRFVERRFMIACDRKYLSVAPTAARQPSAYDRASSMLALTG